MKFLGRTILSEKIRESVSSVLPVSAIIFLLLITLVPASADMFISFLIGTVLLILGMALFTLGADTAMIIMGEYVGTKITKSKKIGIIVAVTFFVGTLITVSEPDLQVLAAQISSIPTIVLTATVGLGVGLLLVTAMLRLLFKIKLKYLLFVFYALIFLLMPIVGGEYIPMAFDAGGVSTGPMTVPFIMALGVGVATIRADGNADDDSFGFLGLCSIGPILAVMFLGMLFPGKPEAADYGHLLTEGSNSREIIYGFIKALPENIFDVVIAVSPIVLFFIVFRFFTGGKGKSGLGKILVGVLYTAVGLIIFLVGVNVGYLPIGHFLGGQLALNYNWILIPLGALIGYFIVAAEPAVQVLKKQVEETTSGTIPGKTLAIALSVGVAVSSGLALFRVISGISVVWFLVPGYLIALVLAFFVPEVFTAIAFDSGGVAAGTMSATFMLPFAVGASQAVGGNVLEDAFGVVGLVAMTPLITIQILGLVYRIKNKKPKAEAVIEGEPCEFVIESVDTAAGEGADDDIIEL